VELRAQLGRSHRDFRLWQDKEGITLGSLWENEIKQAITQSVFFIPFITPEFIRSRWFEVQLDEFLQRENQLGRRDLIFPILYIRVPELEHEQESRKHPALQIIADRKYFDWRSLRHRDINSGEILLIIERFCSQVSKVLYTPSTAPRSEGAQNVDKIAGSGDTSRRATKVFISYRREDTKYQAREIYKALRNVLTPENVFMDIDSIPLGADFVEILGGWVNQCEVLLALIGPAWLAANDPASNQRRLENVNDFVRVEIRQALRRGIPVVPVLLDRAPMPDPTQLPEDIRNLVRRQAEFLEFRTFDTDLARLIKRLELGQ
jgi:hypothetical protein